jgi:hypothetical protein
MTIRACLVPLSRRPSPGRSDTASFLNESERAYVVERLHRDTDGLTTRYDTKFVRHAFFDWKIWVFSACYFGALFPVYSFSLFSPTLVANLGYAATTAQLLSVPPVRSSTPR